MGTQEGTGFTDHRSIRQRSAPGSRMDWEACGDTLALLCIADGERGVSLPEHPPPIFHPQPTLADDEAIVLESPFHVFRSVILSCVVEE